MKLTFAFVLATTSALALATVITLPSNHPLVPWKPTGPNDERSPCPLLNALANHGYLPHDSEDISEEKTVNILADILSIGKELAVSLFQEGLTTNPDANATTFSLADLNRHNISEHDASLSRQDFYFGDDHIFNQPIFDQTRSAWEGTYIDVQSAASARLAWVHTSNATNPKFSLKGSASSLSYGESAAYLPVFGNKRSCIEVNSSYMGFLPGYYVKRIIIPPLLECSSPTYLR